MECESVIFKKITIIKGTEKSALSTTFMWQRCRLLHHCCCYCLIFFFIAVTRWFDRGYPTTTFGEKILQMSLSAF